MKKLLSLLGLVCILLAASLFLYRNELIDAVTEYGEDPSYQLLDYPAHVIEHADLKFPTQDTHNTTEETMRRRPVVVLLHGCGGPFTHQAFWAEQFRELGFPTAIIHSYESRESVDKAAVCAGSALLGAERAVDVLAFLASMDSHDDLKGRQVILAGWSHGAWSAMEAVISLQYQLGHRLMPDLSSVAFDRLAGAMLFYPYCGAISKFARYDWSVTLPTLMILAEEDTLLPARDCINAIGRWPGNDVFDLQVIDGAHHAFDYPPGLEAHELKHDPIATEQALKLVKHFLEKIH